MFLFRARELLEAYEGTPSEVNAKFLTCPSFTLPLHLVNGNALGSIILGFLAPRSKNGLATQFRGMTIRERLAAWHVFAAARSRNGFMLVSVQK